MCVAVCQKQTCYVLKESGHLRWTDGKPVGFQLWGPPYSVEKPAGYSYLSIKESWSCKSGHF